ncbi:MAG: FtsX-like permease family protein [Terrimonas sp.]|nr:FtsX-like permease family protein [Terrimonas sp.]
MIRNYFRIAYRNLKRHKVFSIINITGLAIGIASCLLLFTIIRYELSYDRFHPGYQHLYRVVTEDKSADGVFHTPGIPFPALEALRIDIPDMQWGALFASEGSQVTVLGKGETGNTPEKRFIENSGFFFADPQFFQVFRYTWLSGSPAVLAAPNNTVLTKKTAIKYFGDWKQAMGQLLKLDNTVTVKVAGILEDIPHNTDLPLSIVTSYETAKANPSTYFYSDSWGNTTSSFQIYASLPGNIPVARINLQLEAFSAKNYKDRKRAVRTHFLQPLSQLHFDKRFGTFGDHVTAMGTLWTLGLIGAFIIIMACINFINLSTAQAIGRSKEIGIRKVLGSFRWQLFGQVMGETALIVLAAVILALALATFSLPFIKHIASIDETLGFLNWGTLFFLVILILVVTVLAGLYPAMILSGFKPVLALKNRITSAQIGGISLRRGLVVTQFAISQVLIIGTVVAVTQMKYVQDADLGFAKDAILVFNANTDSAFHTRQKTFSGELKRMPDVAAVSFSSDLPSSGNNWTTNFAYDHRPDENFGLDIKYADHNYFSTYGLRFLGGRGFSESDTTREVVINETLTKKLGLTDPTQAIGKEIRMGSQPWKTIVGVIRDFKTNSLKEEVRPIIIAENRQFYWVTGIKLKSADLARTKAAVEKVWDEVYPEYAYTNNFVDDTLAEFYEQDEQLALLYKLFAGIAIFISCLGLYGLVSFMAAQRTKEVGIRKVLGASAGNIVYLFSREFIILISIAFLIAAPLAYYIMQSWLQDFVYRINLGLGVFLVAIFISAIVALLTVGYKAVRAATANPVKSLRTE